jgi:predicted naringenin-chalcone synthase
LARNGLYREQVNRWAIHPGGPRVIDDLAACLEICDEAALRHSRRILHDRGNMSSATLPHIWESMLSDPQMQSGELVVSLAFGPGLTVIGNIMRKRS